MNRFVKLLHLDEFVFQLNDFHAAADVHAHQIGHYRIGDCHGGTYGAARPRVNVRHYADARPPGEGLVTQQLNLIHSRLLHHICKHLGGVELSCHFFFHFYRLISFLF